MTDSFAAIGISIVWISAVIFVLSWIFISTSVKPLNKIIAIIAIFSLVFSAVLVWREVQGTPKPVAIPPEMIVKSFLIKEPAANQKGRIWLWVIDEEKKEPVNLELPYSKKLHQQLMENSKFRQGIPQKIKKKQKSNGDSSLVDDPGFELIDANPMQLSK